MVEKELNSCNVSIENGFSLNESLSDVFINLLSLRTCDINEWEIIGDGTFSESKDVIVNSSRE